MRSYFPPCCTAIRGSSCHWRLFPCPWSKPRSLSEKPEWRSWVLDPRRRVTGCFQLVQRRVDANGLSKARLLGLKCRRRSRSSRQLWTWCKCSGGGKSLVNNVLVRRAWGASLRSKCSQSKQDQSATTLKCGNLYISCRRPLECHYDFLSYWSDRKALGSHLNSCSDSKWRRYRIR